ncbi:MAG: hypothetical protein LBE92_01240 [Chryseobacterium sp.]|jgi:hypothetical protein|uniref:hypothetical protein n=1 Tax=Chryseobacterium sp. TaxID=1871047 RepID=UPI0028348624|nr:hypothetical protein [Chryseobacterium sp.]MDR2234723.1 hypothetical protein [Chryseobacterium sp.]
MLPDKRFYEQNFLLGLSKKEVINELGHGFNFYPDDIWYYELKRTWWGMKTVLFLVFRNGKLQHKNIKKIYGKIYQTKLPENL